MLKALIFVSLIINIFGIYQMVARAYDWPLAWITLNNVSFNRGDIEGSKMEYKQLSLSYGNFFRATSIFSEPSALGAFNSYILSLLLIPIVYKLKNFVKSRLLWIILLIMSSAAALFTFSMTAFVGFLMVFSGFILTQRPKNLTRFFLIAVSIVLVIIVADAIISQSLNVSVIELFTKRIEGIASFGSGQKEVFGESFGVRLKSSEKAIEIWKEYPISGIGLGLTAYNKLNDLQFADMSFFALIAELGTIGTLAYLLFFISIVYLPFRLIKNKTNHTLFDDNDKRILFVPFFMMLVQIILNFISGNNFINFNFWGFSGFVLSILNTVYLKQGYRIVNLRLVRTPLKQQLAGLFSRPEIKD
jgi:O-antigen ligase